MAAVDWWQQRKASGESSWTIGSNPSGRRIASGNSSFRVSSRRCCFVLFVCLFVVFVRERFENWSSSGGLRIFDAFTEFFLSFFLCVCCFLGFVFWFSRYCARSVTELFSLLFVAVVVVVVVVERRLGRRPVTWSSSQMQRRRSALRRLVKNAIPLPRLIKVSACALHFFDVVPRLSFCGAGVQSHYGSFSANRRSISRFDSKVAARRLSLSLSLFLPDFSWFVCVCVCVMNIKMMMMKSVVRNRPCKRIKTGLDSICIRAELGISRNIKANR